MNYLFLSNKQYTVKRISEFDIHISEYGTHSIFHYDFPDHRLVMRDWLIDYLIPAHRSPAIVRIDCTKIFADSNDFVTLQMHRKSGPAFISRNEFISSSVIMYWYHYGQLHRRDGPAVIDRNTLFWYQIIDGKSVLHRENGPAISKFDYNAWYNNGMLHRIGGPAVQFMGQDAEYWYQKIDGKSKLHNTHGPAITHPKGKAWFVDGVLTNQRGNLGPLIDQCLFLIKE